MASFPSHGTLGAGVCAGVSQILAAPRWVTVLAAIYGFILGMWPDAWDWVSAQFGWTRRWELYTVYHINPPWYLIIQPPFFLHWAVDKLFHDPTRPGWNWWKDRGWIEITMWWMGALLIWWVFWGAR